MVAVRRPSLLARRCSDRALTIRLLDPRLENLPSASTPRQTDHPLVVRESDDPRTNLRPEGGVPRTSRVGVVARRGKRNTAGSDVELLSFEAGERALQLAE